MTSVRMGCVGMGLMCLLAAGCQNRMHDENVALHRQNRELQSQLADRDVRLKAAPDASQLQAMQAEIAQRDAKIKELEDGLRQSQPVGTPSADIGGIEATYDAKAGTMTVNLPGDVLFDSGKATLKESTKKTLDKVVAAIRKDYAGKRVFVVGHTDSDPIAKTKDKWQDNLDLSAERARAVYNYLATQGVDSRLLGTRAMGDTMPRNGKAASRRVEIVVAVG